MKHFTPHDYQLTTIKHIIEHPKAGCFLDMGMGKTVSTLTAIQELRYDLDIVKPLIIAPLKVAETTWRDEILKWEHLQGLRLSIVVGSPKKRIQALNADADVWIINRENVVWLVEYYNFLPPFDMLVIDELSSFKSHSSKRFSALKKVAPLFKRVVGLTGTPAPNGLIDLWAQMYLLDRGERLETHIGRYRDKYFYPAQSNGHIVYKYSPKQGSEEDIVFKISDICISMKAKDYLSMQYIPPIDVNIVLDDATMKQYKEFEKEQILSFVESGVELTALTATALSNKLLQFCNGAVYYDMEERGREFKSIHNAKIEALDELVEQANGQSVMVAYRFQSDCDRIMEGLKQYKPKKMDSEKDIKDWNEGKIRVLLVHPLSAGHGLNLQDGGHILVWFGAPWGLEAYQQTNARLQRQGQKEPVFIYHLTVEGTEDERPLKALTKKDATQEALLQGIKEKVAEYSKITVK